VSSQESPEIPSRARARTLWSPRVDCAYPVVAEAIGQPLLIWLRPLFQSHECAGYSIGVGFKQRMVEEYIPSSPICLWAAGKGLL